MTTFLKGDTTAAITLALADGFDYSGKTVNLEYQGVRRTFTGCVAGGALTFAFAAEETAPMSLGAYPVRVWIEGGGEVLTVHNADVKLRVTDCIADVHGGGAIYLDVHGGLHGIEGLPERFTDEDLRSKVNEIVRRLGGAVAIAVLALLPAFGSTVEVLTAPKGVIYNDQQVVTNVTVDVNDKADKTNTYTKSETDARIVELSPPTSLEPSTNYTDAALGAFASTGAVARANVYGTPTRWTDATGCVWEVVANVWFDHRYGNIFVNGVSIFPSDTTAGEMRGYLYYDPSAMEYVGEASGGWYYNGENTSGTPGVLAGGPDATSLDSGNLTLGNLTNLVGRVALTNDLPDVSGYTTPADVTAAIRKQSLGGIWDSRLGVWWTPIMENGALRYIATTNVNLSAEGNQ